MKMSSSDTPREPVLRDVSFFLFLFRLGELFRINTSDLRPRITQAVELTRL